MKVTLTSKQDGILKSQIDMIVKEIERLQKVYKDVEILELAGFDDYDEQAEGRYCGETEAIEINRIKCRELLSEKEYIETRKELREKIEKRKNMGLEYQSELYTSWNDYMWNKVRGLKSLVRHEFGHAIYDQLNLSCSGELMIIHACYTESEINRELGEYATQDIDEFVAVAFEESFYEDCSDLAKKVRKLIDRKAGILDE